MDKNQVAYCGLLCGYCHPEGSCRAANSCGKRLSPDGCFQYACCTSKGIGGCWECPDAPCGRDMLAPGKIKMRAFVRCIKEDGIEKFLGYLNRNEKNGVVYHRTGITGDYDLPIEDEVLNLLRHAKEPPAP